MCNITKLEPFCAPGPFLWQQNRHFLLQQILKTLQILQSQHPAQHTQQPQRQQNSIITTTTNATIVIAEATIAAANVKNEMLLLLPLLHGSLLGFSVGVAVGVGKIWLLLLVASAIK